MGRSKNSLTVKDKGWNRILASVAAASGSRLNIGVQGKEGSEAHKGSKGLTVAEIAGIHEFGSRDGHIPERSFLRSTIDAGQQIYMSMMEKIANGIMLGRFSVVQGLGLLGEQVVSDVKTRIENGAGLKELAESTVRRKGSSRPLIDTGQMKESITWAYRKELRDTLGRFTSKKSRPKGRNGRFIGKIK